MSLIPKTQTEAWEKVRWFQAARPDATEDEVVEWIINLFIPRTIYHFDPDGNLVDVLIEPGEKS